MTKILGSSQENIEARRRQELLPQSERIHGTPAHLEQGKRLRKWSQKSNKRSVSQRIYRVDGERLCELLALYVQSGKVDPTLLVERGLLASPSPSRKHNVRWEKLNKVTIPLDRLIDHYMVDLRSQNKSPKTISWHIANLHAFERWLKRHRRSTLLGDLDIDVVRQYILQLQDRHIKFEGHPYRPSQDKPLSDFTVQGHVRTLRAFASWLQREGYLEENLLARLKVPKVPTQEIKPLSPEEINKVLSQLNPDTATGARNYAILILMLDSGLRVSELISLSMQNVDLQQGQLLVRGKGNKERIIPIGNKAQKYLQRYIYHFRPEPLYPERDNLILSLDGRPLTNNGLRLIFTRLRGKTGIGRLHAHLLRHTFATSYLKNGGDIFSLQRILGHSSLEMVKRYTHLSDADVVLMHRRFSPMDRLDFKMPTKRPVTHHSSRKTELSQAVSHK